MIQDTSRDRVRTAVLLLAGILVGAVVTVGLVLGATSLLEDDKGGEGLGPPAFVEESAVSGLDHSYDGDFRFFVGGGVAVFDCDDDGRLDLYLAGGERTAGLYRNESRVGGALRFSPLKSTTTDITGVTGAYPLDVDSDGHSDLAVLRVGENVMLRGKGNCAFEPANELWGVDGGDAWTAAFSATWEGSEHLPTLVFGNYLKLTADGERADVCSEHDLLRPVGAGYDRPTPLSPGWCTLSVLFSDWNRDGGRDLRMTNDRHYYRDGEEQLWRVAQGDTPELYTREDGWKLMQIWGMGIASHDIIGNGRPEIFLTSQGDNKLLTLASDSDEPTYEDIALASGANAHRPFAGDTDRPSTAWHPEFDDVNNDGIMDLFVTKGNVEAMPEFAMQDPNNLLLGSPDGTFTEAAQAAGLIDYGRSRGAAVADLNLDGLLDLVVVERGERVRIWRNAGEGDGAAPEPMGNWLAIALSQPGANADAVGSWIEVRFDDTTVSREVTVGGGHAGGELGWAHVGIGAAPKAEIRVQWPDGETGPWMSANANQFLILDRGAGAPRTWAPLQD